MARVYTVSFEDVAVSAAQDLVQIKGATGKVLRIFNAHCGATDTTSPTAQQLKFRCRVLPATVTDGSGGSTPTPAKTDQGDPAATFTALANNTVKATTNGTAQTLDENGNSVYGNYDYTPPRPPTVAVSQAFVFELLSTPSGTLHLSGTVTVEEIG